MEFRPRDFIAVVIVVAALALVQQGLPPERGFLLIVAVGMGYGVVQRRRTNRSRPPTDGGDDGP
jgi:hypothetical protein